MVNIERYVATPLGSTILLDQAASSHCVDQYTQLPSNLRAFASSPKTGSYIMGLIKNFNLPAGTETKIALSLFRILTGDNTFAQLSTVLSSSLKISTSKAETIVAEIEKELIAPIAHDLNSYLSAKKRIKASITSKMSTDHASSNNVINLKDQTRPPIPPLIPRDRKT